MCKHFYKIKESWRIKKKKKTPKRDSKLPVIGYKNGGLGIAQQRIRSNCSTDAQTAIRGYR